MISKEGLGRYQGENQQCAQKLTGFVHIAERGRRQKVTLIAVAGLKLLVAFGTSLE